MLHMDIERSMQIEKSVDVQYIAECDQQLHLNLIYSQRIFCRSPPKQLQQQFTFSPSAMPL